MLKEQVSDDDKDEGIEILDGDYNVTSKGERKKKLTLTKNLLI